MTRILVIEDEPTLGDSLRRGLIEEGYDASVAESIGQARATLAGAKIDAVLLDLMLPDGSGIDLVRSLRNKADTIPVLIVTARDSVEDRIVGLDSGADDYIVKPFSFDEMLARLRAILRRSSLSHGSIITVDDLELDLVNRQALRGGVPLELSPRQFELLAYFMQMPGEIVTREMIAREVWKEPTATWTNVIEVQINHLRKKVEREGWQPILHTIRGKGYLLGGREACRG